MFGREKPMYGYKTTITFPKDEQLTEEVVNNIHKYLKTIKYTKDVDHTQSMTHGEDDRFEVYLFLFGYRDLEKSRRIYEIFTELFNIINDRNYSNPSLKNNITILPFERTDERLFN